MFSSGKACFRRLLLSSLLAVTALLLGTTQATAGPMVLQLEHNGQSITFTDGVGVGAAVGGAVGFGDVNPLANNITAVAIRVGDYVISTSAGSSNTPGTTFSALLSLTNTTIERVALGGSGSLFIRILAENFTDPSAGTLDLGSSAASTFTGSLVNDTTTVKFTSYFDDAATTTFGAGGQPSSTVTLSPNPSLTDGSGGTSPVTNVTRTGAQFSLSSIFEININRVGITADPSGVTEVRERGGFGPTPVPEPASIALACMGLVGFGGYARRKMKASV